MEKSEINREDLKSNIMNNIVFRFDYQGMINSSHFIEKFARQFKGFFLEYSRNSYDLVDFEFNLEDISNVLSIPANEIVKQEIHVFSNNTFGKDEVTLNISIYNTTLVIECKEYTTIDLYIRFIGDYLDFLFQQEEFLLLKRVGLRKIGSNLYMKFNDIHLDFEVEYFPFKESYFGNYKLDSHRLVDILNFEEKQLKVNYIRTLDKGEAYDTNTDNFTDAYQVALDLDAYLSEDSLRSFNYKKELVNYIEYINNSILFDIFKNSVTKKFLNENLNK